VKRESTYIVRPTGSSGSCSGSTQHHSSTAQEVLLDGVPTHIFVFSASVVEPAPDPVAAAAYALIGST
jgi:hypothetical protein